MAEHTKPVPAAIPKVGAGVRSIARNSAYLSVARLANYVVRAVYVLLIARLLGPEMYGVFAYGQAWYLAFFPFALMGLGAIIGREVGRASDRDSSRIDRTLALTLTIRMLAAVTAAIAAAAIGWQLEASALYRNVVLAFSLALAGRAMAVWAEHVFIAHEKSRYALGQEVLFRPLELILGVSLIVVAGAGIQTLALVHAAIWWTQAFVAIGIVRTRLRPVRPLWAWQEISGMIRHVLPIATGFVLANWLTQGPLVLYRHTSGVTEAELGQIALPLQLVTLLSAIPWSIALSALPVLARSSVRSDGKDVRFVDLMTRIAILGGGIVALGGMAFAQPAVEFVFGVRYAPAGGYLGEALWLMIPLSMGTIITQAHVARGQYRSILISALIACITLLVAIGPMVRQLGATGILVAAGMALGVWACLLYVWLHHDDWAGVRRAVLSPLLVVGGALALFVSMRAIDTYVAYFIVALLYIPASRLTGAISAMEWAGLKAVLARR